MVLQYVLNIVYRLVSILHGGPKVLRHNLLPQPAKLALTTKLTLSRQNFTIGLAGKCLFLWRKSNQILSARNEPSRHHRNVVLTISF